MSLAEARSWAHERGDWRDFVAAGEGDDITAPFRESIVELTRLLDLATDLGSGNSEARREIAAHLSAVAALLSGCRPILPADLRGAI
jgi:hypothetical protein